MFVLAVVLTVLLLLETLPSALAGLTRARVGLTSSPASACLREETSRW
jgi:hypothetical protein